MALIAACFAASAGLRLVDPGSAFAVELATPAPVEPSASAIAPEDALMAALRQRESQLDARTERVAEKERIIEAAAARIRDQMAAMEAAEARLAALVRVADQAADKDVGKLVAAFQSMDEKRAGPIFENMDVAFASGLISRMDDATAAEILGALTPERAYSITVHIASQNARAPRE